ncbi:hypothetical protein RI196_03890 [Aeribacillus composti]|uniref:Gp6-like head-tail connector protein n=1 Tax=Aeribacillus composti TaxID=1868734 RepID=A0ABY9WCZ5_9BACI|nr:hypothetical protein [Aeribacillus composti]WNF33838.1 hypothetical protein RI196_03890 [Aeribacillus composti]
MLERLKVRIPDIDETLAEELIKTATDRILLRIGLRQESLPDELESIGVEIVTAMYNRHQMNHEGVTEEKVDVFSIRFIDDLLRPYEAELMEYREMLKDDEDRKVRFL